MKNNIDVQKIGEDEFVVEVSMNGEFTTHEVTLQDEYWHKLTLGKVPKEDLILKSFNFLLERESNESILSKFELSIIGKYFPEYEEEVMRG